MQTTADKKKIKAKYSEETYATWYETMLRIRRFEEKTLLMYSQQKIRGFCHVYIGQEAIAAGLKTALRPEDCMVTAYRVHGLALMKGLTSRECMAELYGKDTGCVRGKGGSMHFFSKEHKFFGGNGIVGAQIPIGAGIAFAEKYNKTDNICVTLFGDGAARQGALHETFNMAMNWKLPVLFICENNQYAMGTSVARTSNVTDMVKIGLSYDMPSEQVDGMRPEVVHEAVSRAAEHIRSGKGPYYLEIKTYRYRGHSVSDPGLYRTKEELEYYKTLDPIGMLEHSFKETGLLPDERVLEIQESIKDEIEDAVQFAEESPWPSPEELYIDNYVERDYPFMKD
ncbi:MAG: pyruvate dehydrogenase (acetyl-transferring) E1 component subunit alpha [Saprospiraceae bacterium]|nr:pyruvate dehydrogenase (acetyl-transferring) E1 component subunit alpha [Saprospiraceae bacterium]